MSKLRIIYVRQTITLLTCANAPNESQLNKHAKTHARKYLAEGPSLCLNLSTSSIRISLNLHHSSDKHQ